MLCTTFSKRLPLSPLKFYYKFIVRDFYSVRCFHFIIKCAVCTAHTHTHAHLIRVSNIHNIFVLASNRNVLFICAGPETFSAIFILWPAKKNRIYLSTPYGARSKMYKKQREKDREKKQTNNNVHLIYFPFERQVATWKGGGRKVSGCTHPSHTAQHRCHVVICMIWQIYSDAADSIESGI